MGDKLQGRVLFFSFLLASLFHFLGLLIIHIRELGLSVTPVFEVTLLQEAFFEKSNSPLESSDTRSSIPAFVSLPSKLLEMNSDSALNMERIKFFKVPEEEQFFDQGQKLIDESALFYEEEIDIRQFYPALDQRANFPFHTLISSGVQSNRELSLAVQLRYEGKNQIQIESRYKYLEGFLLDFYIKNKGLGGFVVELALDQDLTLLYCQIEQSCGKPNIDLVLLRELKKTIQPSLKNRTVQHRGRLYIQRVEK